MSTTQYKPTFFLRFFLVFFLFLTVSCDRYGNEKSTLPKAWVGLWKSEGNLVFYERWVQLTDSSLSGMGFSISSIDTLYSESFRVDYLHDTLCFFFILDNPEHADPLHRQNNGLEIPFKLVKWCNGSWIFENPVYAYPNRIIYKLVDDSTLFARRENLRGNKAIEFRFKKMAINPVAGIR